MKIRLDNTFDHVHIACGLGAIALVCSFIFTLLLIHIRNCHESIFRSRFPNATSVDIYSDCGFSYEDCVCSVQSNSKDCIFHVELIGSRILPLFVFILFCFIVKKFFSFSEDSTRVFVYVLWVLSLLILVGITIGIYWNSCYHRYIAAGVMGTLGCLVIPVFYTYDKAHRLEEVERRRCYNQQRENFYLEAIRYNEAIRNNQAQSYRELL
jgi:hypothetical protein